MTLKMRLITVIMLVLLLPSIVVADSVDVSGSLNGVYSVSLDGEPDNSGIVVLFDWNMRNQNEKTDYKGDMKAVGDYEVWEGRLSSTLLGIGYRVGPIIPWVGAAAQNTKTTKHEMKLQDGNLNKVTTDISDPARGVAFGVSAEHWMDPFGLSGTIAKLPEGFMAQARLKYKVAGIGTAHIGFVYDSVVGNAVVAGLGVTY